jgi:hypothetical protein
MTAHFTHTTQSLRPTTDACAAGEYLEMPEPTSHPERDKAAGALLALLREQVEISKLNGGTLLLDILHDNWMGCLAFMHKVEERFGCQVRSGADPGEYTVYSVYFFVVTFCRK